MSFQRLAIAGLLLFLAGTRAAPIPKEGPKDGEKILGVWKFEKFESAAEVPEKLESYRFEFKKDGTYIVRENEDIIASEGTFKLDATAKPKTIDLIRKEDGDESERSTPAIYQLDGDSLRICFSEDARPTEFKVVNKRDVVVTFKRVAEVKK